MRRLIGLRFHRAILLAKRLARESVPLLGSFGVKRYAQVCIQALICVAFAQIV